MIKIWQGKELKKLITRKEPQRPKAGKFGHRQPRGQARRGVRSATIGAIVLFVFVILVLLSFVNKGNLPAIIGSVSLIAVVFAVIGLIQGISGFRERNKEYLACKIGVGMNGFTLLVALALFIRGII